jgi:hypothetical protein
VLYELVSGRPPFVAPNPLAVVSAHLHQEPQALAQVAPGVSARYAELVHRALRKKPAERFQSADEMREALERLGEPSGRLSPRRPAPPSVTGELEIANRDDFRDFERQLRSLRRSRVVAPLSVGMLIGLAALVTWRWAEVYALLSQRLPSVAASLPASFRPSDLYDGVEHEPNDSPAQANPLPIPPGPDGRRAGGVATMRGHIGAKISDTTGDVDVYRIEIPPLSRRSILIAEWSGETAGEGIAGLDVALTLNRERPGDRARSSAPLVANVDRGGPGRPETLSAAVEAGTYYLAVRERHRGDAGPVERPTDAYQLRVRLAEPTPGAEIEPNDAPDAAEARALRYPQWRALAERNPVGEGTVVHATTSREDPDTYAVAPRGPAELPELVVAIPEPDLALSAQLWVPDAEDLGPPRDRDRVRFEQVTEGRPGALLFVRLPAPPRAEDPALVVVRSEGGEGRYDLLGLGAGSSSGAAVLSRVEALSRGGRTPQALELAAGFARKLPASSARTDVLLAAGKIAEAVAGTIRPEGVRRFERASQLLGAQLLEVEGGAVRYRGAFEAAVDGSGRLAEEAAVRRVRLGAPCTPGEVAARAGRFLAEHPESMYAAEARLWRARALEDRFWRGGGRDRTQLAEALDAWRAADDGRGAAEARDRIAKLSRKRPVRDGARGVCR